MATKNLVSSELTADDKSIITQTINDISAKLPFLIALTDKERRGGMKLGNKTIGFVDKVVDYSQTNPTLVPNYLDLPEFIKDYQMYSDLLEILRILRPLTQNIEDTATEVGVEALSAAMIFYSSVKGAAKQGISGASTIYDDLQQRFPGTSSTKTSDSSATD